MLGITNDFFQVPALLWLSGCSLLDFARKLAAKKYQGPCHLCGCGGSDVKGICSGISVPQYPESAKRHVLKTRRDQTRLEEAISVVAAHLVFHFFRHVVRSVLLKAGFCASSRGDGSPLFLESGEPACLRSGTCSFWLSGPLIPCQIQFWH